MRQVQNHSRARRTITRVARFLSDHWLRITLALGLLNAMAAAAVTLGSGSSVSFSDESDYASIAASIASGHGFSLDQVDPTAFRPPGFPALLAIAARVSDDLLVLRVVNSLILGLVIVLAAFIARRLAGSLAASMTAIALTFSPVALFTATKLYPQTLATAALLGALLGSMQVVANVGGKRIGSAVITGLCGALLTLSVPNHGVTVAVIIVWLIWVLRRQAILPVALVIVTCLIPIGLWSVRNYSVFSEFVPVSTNGGLNLLIGNSDDAGVNTGVNVDVSKYIEEAHRRELNEAAADKYFQSEALRWISENRAESARLYVGKLINTFNIQQEMATSTQTPSVWATLLIGITYLPLLAVFLWRHVAARTIELRPGEPLILCAFWANVVVGAIAFTRLRFRVPLDPMMAIIAMSFLATLLNSALQMETGADERLSTKTYDGDDFVQSPG